jgi:hypothetical protein
MVAWWLSWWSGASLVVVRRRGVHADAVICHIRKTQISLLHIRTRIMFLLYASAHVLSASRMLGNELILVS